MTRSALRVLPRLPSLLLQTVTTAPHAGARHRRFALRGPFPLPGQAGLGVPTYVSYPQHEGSLGSELPLHGRTRPPHTRHSHPAFRSSTCRPARVAGIQKVAGSCPSACRRRWGSWGRRRTGCCWCRSRSGWRCAGGCSRRRSRRSSARKRRKPPTCITPAALLPSLLPASPNCICAASGSVVGRRCRDGRC